MLDDCVRIVKESIRGLGGLDVIVSNAVGCRFSSGGKGGVRGIRGAVTKRWIRVGRSFRSSEICMLCLRRTGIRCVVLLRERLEFAAYGHCGTVLGCQLQRQHASLARSSAYFQRQRRGRRLFDDFVDSGRFRIKRLMAGSVSDDETLGCGCSRQHNGVFSLQSSRYASLPRER